MKRSDPKKTISVIVEAGVKHSIKKYGKTYKLLEKFDERATTNSKGVARSRVVQKYLRAVQ